VSSQPSSQDPFPRESSDPLDRLLLRAPLAQPDGWFTARTVARCRYSEPSRNNRFLAWTHFWPRWAIGGVFGLFLCAFTLQQVHHSQKIHSHKQKNLQEAFEIVASMGTDSDMSTASEDSSF
jgi:hypothetical protein